MAVFVDDLRRLPWPSGRIYDCCHLYADTLEELHRFAESIGLKRCWFHNPKGRFPHYDLIKAYRRKAAIDSGAVEISRRAMARLRTEARRRV